MGIIWGSKWAYFGKRGLISALISGTEIGRIFGVGLAGKGGFVRRFATTEEGFTGAEFFRGPAFRDRFNLKQKYSHGYLSK
jgi:hypothetical protein